MINKRSHNLVNPVVSDLKTENNKLVVQYANSGSKELDVGGSDSGIVEVKDTVTENDTFDEHVLTETQNDGTENEISKFYLAGKQIVGWSLNSTDSNNEITFHLVDQKGATSDEVLTLPK